MKVRLVALVLLLLLSLLTVFKAPAYPFWIAAIFVSGYCWVFILLTLIVLLAGIRSGRYQVAGSLIGVVALALFFNPIVQAYSISANLPAEINKAFNNADSITKTPAFTISRLFNSIKAVPYQKLVYKHYSSKSQANTSLTLDFYPAHQAGKRPCVVVVHGGSWSSGDSRQLPELNSYLAEKGYYVASVNYRLAPAYKNPAPAEDIHQALQYLKQHSSQLHIDTTKFVLLGRSAGGQIALLAAYSGQNSGIKGVIDFYGPADMVWGYSVPANPLIFDSRLIMRRYLGGSYKDMPEKYKASSPVEYVYQQTVPTLIIHGENDVLVAYEHSIKLNAKLEQFGVRHYFLSLPWATHGFDYHLNGPGGQLSTYAVWKFVKTVTR